MEASGSGSGLTSWDAFEAALAAGTASYEDLFAASGAGAGARAPPPYVAPLAAASAPAAVAEAAPGEAGGDGSAAAQYRRLRYDTELWPAAEMPPMVETRSVPLDVTTLFKPFLPPCPLDGGGGGGSGAGEEQGSGGCGAAAEPDPAAGAGGAAQRIAGWLNTEEAAPPPPECAALPEARWAALLLGGGALDVRGLGWAQLLRLLDGGEAAGDALLGHALPTLLAGWASGGRAQQRGGASAARLPPEACQLLSAAYARSSWAAQAAPERRRRIGELGLGGAMGGAALAHLARLAG